MIRRALAYALLLAMACPCLSHAAQLPEVLVDYAESFKAYDQLACILGELYEGVADYAKQPSEQARKTAETAIAAAEDALEPFIPPESSYADNDSLIFELGIAPGNYFHMFSSLPTFRDEIQIKAETYREQLDTPALFACTYRNDVALFPWETQLRYTINNGMLLSVDPNASAPLYTDVIEKLKSFQLYGMPFVSDQVAVISQLQLAAGEIEAQQMLFEEWLEELEAH